MGFISTWKSKHKSTFDEDGTQRSNSATLPRKPAFSVVDPDSDGRDSFLIKASHTPRLQAPPGTAPSRFQLHPRSASVVVAPSASALHTPSSQHTLPPKKLLPEYKTSSQFHHKVELYTGSISTVYKAQCTLTKSDVIIKQYIKEKMSSRSTHKMQREVQIMYMLRGKEGVAHILGNFEDEQYYYIIMEHCAGGDLYHRMIVTGGLEEHWACWNVITPLLRVLHNMHTEGHIVHRDIKPENIFLTKGDELRLGDFGLAIKQDEELPFLRAGTLDYMAPEVLANRVVENFDEAAAITPSDLQMVGLKHYNEKVDVWAVGILAYELLVGEAPFFHKVEKETAKLIQQSTVIPFPTRMRMSAWADFVTTALCKDPRQRPSAAELLRHPWIQQHSPSSLLRRGLGLTLSRAASLPAPASQKAQQTKQTQQMKQAQQAKHAQQQSVQIRVDATGGGGGGGSGVAVDSVAAAAAAPCNQVSSLVHPELAPTSKRSNMASGRGSACEAGSTDALRVDKRGSLADLRRTRSTGEAEALYCHSSSSHHTAGPRYLPYCAPRAGAGGDAVQQGRPDPVGADEAQGALARGRCSPSQTPAGGARCGRETATQAAALTCSGEAQCSSTTPSLAVPVVTGAAAMPCDAGREGRNSAARSQAGAVALDTLVSMQQGGRQEAGQQAQPQLQEARPVTPAAAARPASRSGGSSAHIPSTAVEAQPLASRSRQAPSPYLATTALPPAVPASSSIASRPKSHSLPKSPFSSKSFSLFGGASESSPSGVAPGVGRGGDPSSSVGGRPASSTASGSRILDAWGKKPSRLSVATGSGAASDGGPGAEGATGPRAPKSPGAAYLRSGGTITGSNAGTQEELRGAKSGSINRLKLYLTRQRAA